MIEVEEIMGPGFLIFFQVPGSSGGGGGDDRPSKSLFKSEFSLDRLEDEDEEIMAIIMAFMFTRR